MQLHVTKVALPSKYAISTELKLKLSKFEFFKHEVPFLGSIVGEYRVQLDLAKVQSILD